MKTKLFLILAFFIGSYSIANAQFVNEVPLSQLDADYVRIWADNGPVLSSKVTVRIDFGQGGRIPQITDERRRALSFNSMMAVLNMMSKQGFELIEVVRDSKDELEMFYLKRKDSSIPYIQSNPNTTSDYNVIEQDK